MGELTTLPRPPSRLERGYPLPIPNPLDAYGVSISAPRPEFHFLKVGNPNCKEPETEVKCEVTGMKFIRKGGLRPYVLSSSTSMSTS